MAVIDDLKYLRKGGRLPAAVAVAGGMLGIKPLITIKEGKVVMAGKARGLPGAYVALFKKIEELGGISTCADAPGPAWVPMTQPIWRTRASFRPRFSCR